MSDPYGGMSIRLSGDRVHLVITYGSKEYILELSLTGAQHMADLLLCAVQLAEDQALERQHG
jgi:hypothetical protein